MSGVRKVASAAALLAIVAVLSLGAAAGGMGPFFDGIRALGTFYLSTAPPQIAELVLGPSYGGLSSYSPEVVTSIVWDYRGLDTYFETAVFFLAIIGAVAIYRGIEEPVLRRPASGLSPIVRAVTKFLIPINIAVAASIALHGHLTPGGGFQAGAALAVAPVIVIVVFSRRYLLERGVTKLKALFFRSVGLIGIALVVLIPVIWSMVSGNWAWVMQNQWKPGAEAFSYPAYLGGTLISGSIWFLNLFEFLAVSFGFTILFLLISIDEDTVRSCMIRGGEECDRY